MTRLRKTQYLITLWFLCVSLFLIGCNQKQTKSTPTKTENSDTKIQKLNIDDIGDIIGISGDYCYYMIHADDNSQTLDYHIMKYDLLTGEKTKIGEVNGISVCSNVYAFLNADTFFSTFGVATNGQDCNIHTKMDANKETITIMSTDNSFPPLVQSISVNEEYFIEYQPQMLEDGSYRYVVRKGDQSGNMTDIIVKDGKIDSSGEMIVDICAYDDILYSFEYDAGKRYVCYYDLQGNQLTKENVDLIDAFLDVPDEYTGQTENMWSIEVINGYYFFETLNDKRLVLHKKDDVWEKREDLVASGGTISNLVNNFNPRGKDYKKVILYDYNAERLSYLDTDTGEMVDLELKIPGATYCMTDGKQLVFLNENSELLYVSDVFVK